MNNIYKDKRIWISGITGSWARELIKQLLPLEVKEIVGISRNEFNQVKLLREVNDKRLKLKMVDVRDYEAVNESMKGCDIGFHLAAIKHIDISEVQIEECIKTNITGTENVIKAAINNNIERCILSNTDKSCSPSSVYGCSKFIVEKLFIQANLKGKTKFASVRAGNVLGSNGSFPPHCIELIKEGKDIPITDFRMSRYFITIPEAIKLLLTASEMALGAETFIVNMPACYIKDLAQVLIDYYGNDRDIKIVEVGKRPGEKLSELLISKHESDLTYKLDNDYFVLLPNIDINNIHEIYRFKGLEKVDFEEFSSETNIMSSNEIYKMLGEAGFLE